MEKLQTMIVFFCFCNVNSLNISQISERNTHAKKENWIHFFLFMVFTLEISLGSTHFAGTLLAPPSGAAKDDNVVE